MNVHPGLGTLVVVSIVITGLGATGPAAGELRPIGHVGGFVDAIATDGDAVFAGIGGTLTRLTTASPPTRSAWTLLGGDGHVRDIAILGAPRLTAAYDAALRLQGAQPRSLDGDEMTRIIWHFIREKLIEPVGEARNDYRIMAELAARNVVEVLAGRPALTPVTG